MTTRTARKKSSPRLKLLRAIRKASSHRYDRFRALGMTVSLAILFAVPLSGLARVDLWGGRHALVFAAAPFKHGLAGVIVGIGAMYVVTFLVNMVGGRLFCGWGCPVAQVSRFGEALEVPGLKGRRRLWAELEGALFSLALVASFMAWWVDLRVLGQGSTTALAWAWGVLLAGVAAAWAHGRWWRWEFCKSACPIGLYYSFVSPAGWYGVHFRNQTGSCIECDACDNVCPVDLTPRDLMAPAGERPGLAIAAAPGRNHCLECGDCVRACDWMIERQGAGEVPLLLGFFSGPQRLDMPPAANRTRGIHEPRERKRSGPLPVRAEQSSSPTSEAPRLADVRVSIPEGWASERTSTRLVHPADVNRGEAPCDRLLSAK